MQRRKFLLSLASAASLPLIPTLGFTGVDSTVLDEIRNNWHELLPPDAPVSSLTDVLEKSAAEWRAELSPAAYRVLFEDGTEAPFSSPLNDEKRAGVFVCAACKLPLFSSAMKYDSGTGWPSFFTSIPGHLDTKLDFKLIWPRTEYHCRRCGGHQGHVFEDGPAPTGERWCNNGVALDFIATS